MNKNWLKNQRVSGTKSAYDNVQEELKVLQRVDNRFIIWLEEIIDDPESKRLCIVTEYHSLGSIKDLVDKLNKGSIFWKSIFQSDYTPRLRVNQFKERKRGLPTILAWQFFRDTLRALYYCHKTIKVIHRDIKPDNIVINSNFEAVLIDFGVCAVVDH